MSSNTSIDLAEAVLTTSRMATMAQRIKELRESAAISQAKFGKLFDVSREAVSQWESGKSIPEHEKQKRIAEKYSVSLDWIAGKELTVESLAQKSSPEMVASRMSGSVQSVPGTTSYLDQPRDLPILGSARAGTDGFFLDQGEVQGMARRPPILQGIANAFAVYVRDGSMSPAYEPGWVVHVHPHRPVKPGDNVVIEMLDGQAFIKRLIRRTGKHVICKQWTPEKEVIFDVPGVKSIRLVVGSSIEE